MLILIMLSMSIHNSNIYLLRETIEFGNIININEEGMPIFFIFLLLIIFKGLNTIAFNTRRFKN